MKNNLKLINVVTLNIIECETQKKYDTFLKYNGFDRGGVFIEYNPNSEFLEKVDFGELSEEELAFVPIIKKKKSKVKK
jgi:hypothetical protein